MKANQIDPHKPPQTATELLQAEVLRVTADNNELRAKLAARDSADAAMTSNDIADRLDILAAEMRRQPATARTPASDWLAQLLDVVGGDVIGTDVAAMIVGCHPDTIRSRAVIAMEARQPIGILVAGAVWLFSQRRLLDAIEAHDGLPERLAAATRADKARVFRSRPTLTALKPIATEIVSSMSRAKGTS
jgi:hypothetical protein